MAEMAAATMKVDVSLDGQRMRCEALDFAIRLAEREEKPEVTVERAGAFYEFLKGGDA